LTAREDDAFRHSLHAYLAEHPPPDAGDLRRWQRELHAAGWVGIQWPAEHGGRSASPTQIAIYNEELARAGAPDLPGRVGLTLVGPTLMVHGTDEQRARWLLPILDATDVWCQLFSEPGAGSDLAALSTRAERHGDMYVVTGQKVWSSYATLADWGLALVRTDPAAPRSKGISMLAIPMTAKGVDVRPLRQLTGECEFNEVFLDEVEVPVANVIGAENDGWRATNTTLGNERAGSFIWKEQVRHELAVDRLREACAKSELLDDPVVRQQMAQCAIDAALFRWHNARTLDRVTRGEEIGTQSSVVKLFWAEASQRLYSTACRVLGASALLADDEWTRGLLTTRANSIMGGTSEIQRTIIGERILGLPREPDG
jgi:alkylation response protein AidB-like acyl-CoA dehydrogenase